MESAEFEVYQDSAGEWRWRLKASNDEVVADSAEGYTRQGDASRAAERVQQLAGSAGFKVVPG